MPHHVDRFCAALAVLAGHGHIKQRLIDAFEQHLLDFDHDTLPLPVRERFTDLYCSMSQVAPLNGEGPICASVRKMSIEEADQCARQFVQLFRELAESADDSPETLPAVGDTADVPAMLLKSV